MLPVRGSGPTPDKTPNFPGLGDPDQLSQNEPTPLPSPPLNQAIESTTLGPKGDFKKDENNANQVRSPSFFF